jgi:hypothetical protein
MGRKTVVVVSGKLPDSFARLARAIDQLHRGYDPYNSLGTNPTRGDVVEFDLGSESDANRALAEGNNKRQKANNR